MKRDIVKRILLMFKPNWVALTIIFICVVLMIPSGVFGQAPSTGRITGVLVDSQTGEPLIGANVYLDGTSIGAGTDLDGSYVILNVPEGTYTLVISMLSYAETRVTDLKVKANETTQINLSVKPEELTGETVTVEARALENTEALLLKKRQLSNSVSDAISAEAISRSGSGNAAEAMTQVTGASVVDGKYVYIRGLGDRYSSTMLNGAELPSSDPEKKAVHMDMFPSNLLDNIVTLKTFTPDKPGNFSGGMVDVATKNYPEKFTLKFSTGSSYNTLASLQSDYLSYRGGSKDWLGMDDGTRDIPDEIKNPKDIPTLSQARANPESAQTLDQASKSFNSVMSPVAEKTPVNQSYALSIGNQIHAIGRPFGYMVSFSYKRDYSFYNDGRTARWQVPGDVSKVQELNPKILLDDSKGTDEVNWGGLISLNTKLSNNNEVSANVFYTRSGESSSRYLVGTWPEQFGINTDAYFETRVLKYVERSLQSYQLSGEHYFEKLLGMKLDWKGSISRNSQEEPDTRYFSDHFSNRTFQGRDTTIYSISTGNYPNPTRYFRTLKEDGSNLEMNMAFPFEQWSGLQAKLKFGGFYSKKNRTFEELRFEYERPSSFRYTGNDQEFFSPENTGIIGYDANNNPIWGNYIQLAPDAKGGDYDGEEKVTATYTMIELPLYSSLRFVGGARFEATRMDVASADTTKPENLRRGTLDNNDWLPSVNLIYQVINNMNVRASYGKTLARPTMREKAPYVSYEFVNDYSFAGNVNLKRTLIDNFDLRWEWFVRPGELFAISGFYKKFTNPIERTLVSGSEDNPEVTYRNVDEGRVIGLELEARKRLDGIYSRLRYFQIGVNLSLVNSKVDIPREKLVLIIDSDPNREVFTENTRPLQGQSAYILNIDFGYNNYKSGTYANIYFNVFGERLAEVTSDATPDVYEQPRELLNFNMSQKLFKGLGLKLAAKNILDSKSRFVHKYKGEEYVRSEHELGRSYSVGLSYEIN